MWDAISLVASNLGVQVSTLVTLIVNLGAIIFFAVDFKKGVVFLLLSNGGLFMWFYEAELAWSLPLTLFFVSLVVMALSIYTMRASEAGSFGGVI